jgi:ribosomal protein S18 acetylase RimI-like enzyme
MIHTRISRIEDVYNISHTLASSWKTAYRGIVHDDYLDALPDNHWVEYLTTGLKNDSVFSMVIESNQEIIGAAILSNTEKEHEVNLISFYLLPDRIGKGFGHIFYSDIETELRNRGFQNCVIAVLENNSRAIRFYEAQSFIDTGKTIDAVLGIQNYSCKILEKTLK